MILLEYSWLPEPVEQVTVDVQQSPNVVERGHLGAPVCRRSAVSSRTDVDLVAEGEKDGFETVLRWRRVELCCETPFPGLWERRAEGQLGVFSCYGV